MPRAYRADRKRLNIPPHFLTPALCTGHLPAADMPFEYQAHLKNITKFHFAGVLLQFGVLEHRMSSN
jgi:hypothetical protein